ncbi:hypothetical protein HYDPIDRAFT_50891, partial [Hydnomerulius pinastri MD-312]
QGHTARINSIAFFPDGKKIVSGSDDNTLRIWSSESGQQIGEPLQGHEHTVVAVTVSND